MKTNSLTLRRVVTTVAAGKLALSASMAQADSSCGLGKNECEGIDADHYPELALDEFGVPMRILTPPSEGMDWEDTGYTQEEASDDLGKSGYSEVQDNMSEGGKGSADPDDPNAGIIWAGDIDQIINQADGTKPRIQFIVSGIRNDRPVGVFLAYSTTRGVPEQWDMLGGFHSGKLELGLDAKLVGGVMVNPLTPIPLPDTPLGTPAGFRTQSIHIPVDLKKLNMDMGDHIYFQALIAPQDEMGNFRFADAQASEVDHFIIERYVEGDENNTGSKRDDEHGSGGKGSENNLGDPGTNATDPDNPDNPGGK